MMFQSGIFDLQATFVKFNLLNYDDTSYRAGVSKPDRKTPSISRAFA